MLHCFLFYFSIYYHVTGVCLWWLAGWLAVDEDEGLEISVAFVWIGF
jgi:hypothetical protein